MTLFYISANHVWLNRRHGILISASVFYLFWHIVLIEMYKENLASDRYEVGKVRSVLIAFSDSYRYSSLMLHQNLTSSLKVTCNVESELYKWTCLKVHWSMSYFEYNFYLRIIFNGTHWSFGNDWFTVMQIFQMLTHFIIQFLKNHIITTDPITSLSMEKL